MEIREIISSGLLELYALGISSPEESKQVEGWIIAYPEVKRELDQVELGLENYAKAYAVSPSAQIKEKVMSALEGGTQLRAVTTTENIAPVVALNGKQKAVNYTLRSYFKYAAAACFVLLIGSLILNYIYYDKYNVVSSELAKAKTELETQKSMASSMDEEIRKMTSKNAVPVSLNGTDHSPEASAKIFWMKDNGDVYVSASALPPAKAGMQYQLWAIVDGQPKDAGMIETENGNIYHIQKMKSFGKAEAFAITLEQKGGSPTPKGDMYVISKI